MDYPRLCPFFDQYIYGNQQVDDFLSSETPLSTTMSNLFRATNIPATELKILKQELLSYAANNMVKLTVYIESPYVTLFQTNEVIIIFQPYNT